MRCALFVLAPLAGCALEPEGLTPVRTIDVDVAPIRGISVDGDALALVVEGEGIVRIDRDGRRLDDIAPGSRGLWDVPYKDVAARGNDVFVLLSDNEGYLYDATTEQQRVHFCVEPGFVGEEPLIEQKNDALAVSGNIIVAAPRFYEDGTMIESALRTYRAADGVQIASVDHTDLDLELTGLAVVGETIVGVDDDELHEFTLDGEHKASTALEDMGDASGLAVDGDELLIPDGDRILVYPRL